MKNIEPRIVGKLVKVAEDQPEYTPVYVLPATHHHYSVKEGKTYNSNIMCFEPSPEDRQAIINGENIYISLLTGGEPQQPILITVGPRDMARWHNLQVKQRPLEIPDGLPECQGVTMEGL